MINYNEKKNHNQEIMRTYIDPNKDVKLNKCHNKMMPTCVKHHLSNIWD